MGMFTDGQTVADKTPDPVRWLRAGNLPRLGAVVRCQPVAVAMDLEAELCVHAFGRPCAVTAQVSTRPICDELRHVGVQRRLALSARGHRAVAEQRVYLGTPEGQGGRHGAFERDRVCVGANGRRHQHARPALGGSSGRPP